MNSHGCLGTDSRMLPSSENLCGRVGVHSDSKSDSEPVSVAALSMKIESFFFESVVPPLAPLMLDPGVSPGDFFSFPSFPFFEEFWLRASQSLGSCKAAKSGLSSAETASDSSSWCAGRVGH